MEHEKRIVQQAMDAALAGVKEDPCLYRKILERREEPIRVKKNSALVLVLSLFLLGSIALATVYLPSMKEVLPWVIKEEKIVLPISQTHNSEWLDLEVTEVYFSEYGLHLMFRIDPVNPEQLIVSDFDFQDKYPYRTIMDAGVHIDEWRNGKEVLLVDYLTIKHDSGWHSARRVDNTVYLEVSSDDMLMRKEQVAKGITFDVYGYVTNLQTNKTEHFTVVLELPPLEMQEAELKNK